MRVKECMELYEKIADNEKEQDMRKMDELKGIRLVRG